MRHRSRRSRKGRRGMRGMGQAAMTPAVDVFDGLDGLFGLSKAEIMSLTDDVQDVAVMGFSAATGAVAAHYAVSNLPVIKDQTPLIKGVAAILAAPLVGLPVARMGKTKFWQRAGAGVGAGFATYGALRLLAMYLPAGWNPLKGIGESDYSAMEVSPSSAAFLDGLGQGSAATRFDLSDTNVETVSPAAAALLDGFGDSVEEVTAERAALMEGIGADWQYADPGALGLTAEDMQALSGVGMTELTPEEAATLI